MLFLRPCQLVMSVFTSGATCRSSPLTDDLDHRVLPSLCLNQFEQETCVIRAQPDAAMGDRPAQIVDVVASVNGVSGVKED